MNMAQNFLQFGRFGKCSRLFIFSVLNLFAIISSKNINASHLMGADITWQCIDSLRFKVTLAFYRDCRGVSMSDTRLISLNCVNNSNKFPSILLDMKNVSIRDVTPTCTNNKPCNPANTSGSSYGIEELLYIGIMDFRKGDLGKMVLDGCCRFSLEFQECCRNSYITTGMESQIFSNDAEIDICNIRLTGLKGCDNSPELRNPPEGYICCNQEFYFNNGAVDKDGDSLVYSLVTPKNFLGSDFIYYHPFDSIWPMSGYCTYSSKCPCKAGNSQRKTEGICFDSQTGDLSFVPINCNEVGILTIKIEQYRFEKSLSKWIYIGFTKRDIQLIVTNCNNNNPPFFKGSQHSEVCEGEKICMNIIAEDKMFNKDGNIQQWVDTINLTWNYGIPNATFNIGNPYFTSMNQDFFSVREAEICWQTQKGDGRDNPYTFTVTARDNACPRNAITSKSFTITVKKEWSYLNITNQDPLKLCGLKPITINYSSNLRDDEISWQHNGKGFFNEDTLGNTTYTPHKNDFISGKVQIRLSNKQVNACNNPSDSILFLIRPYPEFTFEAFPTQGCQPLTVDFKSKIINPEDDNVSYFWELDSQTRTSSDPNPKSIIYDKAGIYNIKLTVRDNIADCETELIKYKYISVFPNPKASFITKPENKVSIAYQKVIIKDYSSIEEGQIHYLWDFGTPFSNNISEEREPEFYYDRIGRYLISLILTSDKGCKDTAEQWIEVAPDVIVFFPNVFSPNNSGPYLNNKFYVSVQGIIDFDVKIFNRWGEKIYESKDPNEGWDGKFNGIDCKQDVYTFIITVIGIDGKEYDYKGTLTLLR